MRHRSARVQKSLSPRPIAGVEISERKRLSYWEDVCGLPFQELGQPETSTAQAQAGERMSKDHQASSDSPFSAVTQVSLALEVCDHLRGMPQGGLLEELIKLTNTGSDPLLVCLKSLESHRIIRQEANKRYHLGYRLIETIHEVLRSSQLSVVAYPELQRLRDLCGETVFLAEDDGTQAINMGAALSQHANRMEDPVGTRYPYHCTSVGKVFAAHLPEDKLRSYLNAPLTPRTEHSIRERKALESHLLTIRDRGYATSDQEFVMGRRSIAAPIFGPDGLVIGAVGVSGPCYRITKARLPAMVEEIRLTARRITQKLAMPKLTPRNAQKTVSLSNSPSTKVLAPQWHRERGSFLWCDQETNAIWAGYPGQKSELIKQFSTPVSAMVVTSSQQIVTFSDNKMCNQTTGKVSPFELVPFCSVPGTANDIWGVVNRNGENVLVNFTLDGQSSDHAVLPRGVRSMAYCAVTGSLYLAYPDQGTIQSYNLITRHLKQICQFAKATGRPTGMAIDGRWRLWVSFEDGWSLARLSLNGAVQARYNLPVPCPNGLCFDGVQGQTLLITSSREGQESDVLDYAPLSGHAVCYQYAD